MDRAPSSPSTLAWFAKLRWGEIAALVLVFFAGERLRAPGTAAAVSVLIALQIGSNAIAAGWARRSAQIRPWAIPLFTGLDCVVLTAVLLLGRHDAGLLAVMYLVNVALTCVLAGPRWTWTLVAASTLAVAGLHLRPPNPQGWQLLEAVVAYAAAAALLVIFIQRTRRVLRDRDEALNAARQRAAHTEKVASLTTLAAGAAHELGTPLSTIAVAAKELERALRAQTAPGPLLEDVRLIRAEVDRCRGILSQLATEAGATQGEAPTPIALAALLRPLEGPRVRVELEPTQTEVVVPALALRQALTALVSNALDASPEAAVTVRARLEGAQLELSVEDTGPGMSPEILARAGEPFFTTKSPGRGMGLGLFLVRSVIEQLGGTFSLASSPSGTTARLRLPVKA